MALGSPPVYDKSVFRGSYSRRLEDAAKDANAYGAAAAEIEMSKKRGIPSPIPGGGLSIASAALGAVSDAAQGLFNRDRSTPQRFAGDAIYNWKPSAGLLPSGWNPSSTVFSGGVSSPIAFSDAMTFQPSFKVDTNVSSFWGS